MATRIIVRHLNGSKVNQVEQFPIEGFPELTIGREPGSTIVFDAVRDDAVSRKHAVIRVAPGDPPGFKLDDLRSSNGTLLNGERITGETELLPGDTIEFGPGGPKIGFYLEPPPQDLVARTRLVSTAAAPSAATRIIDAAEAVSPSTVAATVPLEPVPRPSVGRNTVMHMLAEQRQATSRIGMYVLAGVLAVIALVGGLIYYKTQSDVAEQGGQLAEQKAKLLEQSSKVAEQNAKMAEQTSRIQQEEKVLGLSPEEIVAKYGNATVVVKTQWRLYDRETGKPLFHKTVLVQDNLLPAYVRWQGNLYRWLTTEDELHSNFKLGLSALGTGFVIADQGVIVTNKHVAQGWLVNYNQNADYENGQGVYFEAQDKFYKLLDQFKKNNPGKPLPSNRQPMFQKLASWHPEDGGPVFANTQPVIIGNNTRTFEGRNEELSVRFPGSRVDVEARVLRTSTDADAALMKIDATQNLATIPMAGDNSVKEGERVIVLGYPSFTRPNLAIVSTVENAEARRRIEDIPQPTVTTGNISNISLPPEQIGNITLAGAMGHVYQLTVPSSHGNSGGPVFNAAGEVIGLFTYISATRETVTFAVPIKYARELLQMQRTN